MLATPAISSTPLHNARLHARPPSGIEPQAAPELERQARTGDRGRPARVIEAERSDRSASTPDRVPPERSAKDRARQEEAGARPAAVKARVAEDAAPRVQQAGQLDPNELAELTKLEERDRKVRAHEAAHAQAGGRFAGSPRYDFVVGPDGKRYAVGGRVQIDMSTDPSDPEATIRKMQIIKRAALAPVDPSPTDRRVAALAERLARAAEADLRAARAVEREVTTSAQSDRLTRLAVLFAQTELLPAPEPTTNRAA
ncbi:MAG: putative metalloprotease CJM1_0395 family protein [Pseudomonadota bacterium]